jgi:hypothetical protein
MNPEDFFAHELGPVRDDLLEKALRAEAQQLFNEKSPSLVLSTKPTADKGIVRVLTADGVKHLASLSSFRMVMRRQPVYILLGQLELIPETTEPA